MFIRSIHLVDWKSYTDATFNFPDPEPGRNAVLIGAKNGFGKTSLLEAIILGLFGRDGLPLIGRANFGNLEDERAEVSYGQFLERAFHAQAREYGRSSMSVELTFITDNEEQIRVDRVWHFSGNGRHRPEEEEVRIWHGLDDELLPIPTFEDRREYVRSYISQQFLPVHLAQFFLFDGEQVQRLARQDMSAQVKYGIEGILGVHILRELGEDLRTYAKDRRRKVGKVGDENIDRLRAEIHELEIREEKIRESLKKASPQIENLKRRRDNLVSAMGSMRGGDYASLSKLFETKERFNRNLDKYKEQFRQSLSSDFALSIAGRSLQSKVKERLEAEIIREQWELSKKQDEGKLSRFLNSLDETPPKLEPPLMPRQKELLEEQLKNAWQNLWHPPPDNCADSVIHYYLDLRTREFIIDKLNQLDLLTINSIQVLIQNISNIESEIRNLDAQVAANRGVDDQVKDLANEIKLVTDELSKSETERGQLERDLVGIRAQLTPKRQELGKLEEKHHAARPQLHRSAYADRIADMLEAVVDEAFPSHIDDVAKEMSKAYLSMAHKGFVRRIEIGSDCTVRLLGSGEKRDLREMDASAGESQIFALSLIAAIAKISKRCFPIVMDTPLARLDPDHRRNVLKYFTDTDNQVILLSQPDEVYGEYLELIRPKVIQMVHLEYKEISDGIGRSILVDGYFDEAI